MGFDGFLTKLDLDDLNDTLWNVQITLYNFTDILFDRATERLFVFEGGGRFSEINPQTGSHLWDLDPNVASNYSFRDYKIVGNFLYCIWDNVGFTGASYWVSQKYNLLTHTIEWTTFMAPAGVGINGTPPGTLPNGYNDSYSMDVDSNGDVYITGDYRGGSVFPKKSNMAFVKLSGADGSNGEISFGKLPLASYEVWVDDIRIDNSTAPIITLTNLNPSFESVEFLLHSDYLEILSSSIPIERPQPGFDLSVYPNPSQGSLFVEYSSLKGSLDMVVRDLYGRTICQEILSEGRNLILHPEWQKGIYLLEFWYQGQLLTVRKQVWN